MKKLSTSGAFIQWSILLWLLPFEFLLLSVWLRLGVSVTFTCINMCTLRVFVIKLPLPGDIRFVIEDEEVEYKRGFYPMVHAFMAVAIWVFTILDEINDMQWLTWSNLLMVMFTSFASQRKVSVQELSWHLHQNKFSCCLTSSNGLCDHHYISAIFCLCDCLFGGLCDLCLH